MDGNVSIFAVSIDIKSMGKSFFSRVTACAVACVFFIATPSCVNNKYELSEENLDMNVTVFQEDLFLPEILSHSCRGFPLTAHTCCLHTMVRQ